MNNSGSLREVPKIPQFKVTHLGRPDVVTDMFEKKIKVLKKRFFHHRQTQTYRIFTTMFIHSLLNDPSLSRKKKYCRPPNALALIKHQVLIESQIECSKRVQKS